MRKEEEVGNESHFRFPPGPGWRRLVARRRGSGHHHHRDRLFKLKIQLRFGRNSYLLSVRGGLIDAAARSPDRGANRSTLATPGNRADDRPQHRAPADFLSGVRAARGTAQRIGAANERIRAAA